MAWLGHVLCRTCDVRCSYLELVAYSHLARNQDEQIIMDSWGHVVGRGGSTRPYVDLGLFYLFFSLSLPLLYLYYKCFLNIHFLEYAITNPKIWFNLKTSLEKK